jgi:hypothetical protein
VKDLRDGISKTIIATESREREYCAWISGGSMWVVAASPNSLAENASSVGLSDDGFIAVIKGMISPGEAVDKGGLALNFGDDKPATPEKHYLKSGEWGRNNATMLRKWGPSSEHSGSVITHVFADAHARGITADVDPAVYLRAVTRSDGDPVDLDRL